MIPTLPGVATIAQTIQLSLAPVFMLAAIGQLLNVLAGRLSRVIDRARRLQERLHDPRAAQWRHRTREYDRWELQLLDRRMSIVNSAMLLAVASAVMTGLVIALLFVANLTHLHLGTLVALSFILAVLLLVGCLCAFIIEVRLALRANHVRLDLFDDDRGGEQEKAA